jgi:tight adherence protein B
VVVARGVVVPVTAAGATARRLAALAGTGASGTAPAEARLRSLVASFALPGDLDAQVRLAAALSLGGPLVVALAVGPLAAVLTAAAVLVGALVLRRSAPARRAAADERALPELLEAVARRLRAGGSLQQAITGATVAADPRCATLPSAWARVQQAAPAIGVAAALDAWAAEAADTPSVQLATAALAMANETGGSPARAVDGVASTLRSRLAVAAEVRALSSQARASAAVIALAPLAFGTAAGLTDARTAAFFTTPLGLTLLALGLALDALGAWWMSHLCRVRP